MAYGSLALPVMNRKRDESSGRCSRTSHRAPRRRSRQAFLNLRQRPRTLPAPASSAPLSRRRRRNSQATRSSAVFRKKAEALRRQPPAPAVIHSYLSRSLPHQEMKTQSRQFRATASQQATSENSHKSTVTPLRRITLLWGECTQRRRCLI